MWQSGSACYNSPTLANMAAASVQSGAVVPVGLDVAVISVGVVTDTSIQYSLTSLTTGSTAVRVVGVNPPVCGLLEYPDALAYGAGITLCFVTVWGFRLLGRYIFDASNESTSYGNS